MKLTVLIATAGRAGLERTIQSVVSQCYTNDETLVVGATHHIERLARQYGCRFLLHPAGNDWGHTERNYGQTFATGDYICHLDDDDVAAPGSRDAIERAATAHPGRPLMFKMAFANGGTLWADRRLKYGNVGTPMIVLPNDPSTFGYWEKRYGGDFKFMTSMKWRESDIVWCEDVIALIRPVAVCV